MPCFNLETPFRVSYLSV